MNICIFIKFWKQNVAVALKYIYQLILKETDACQRTHTCMLKTKITNVKATSTAGQSVVSLSNNGCQERNTRSETILRFHQQENGAPKCDPTPTQSSPQMSISI